MATVTASASGGFSISAITVNSNSAFASSDTLAVPDQLRGRPAIICGTVGSGGAIGHLTITAAAQPGGTHVDWLVDPDGSATNAYISCTTNSYATSANGSFQIHLTSVPPELIFKAKSVNTNTTLTIVGTVLGGAQPRL